MSTCYYLCGPHLLLCSLLAYLSEPQLPPRGAPLMKHVEFRQMESFPAHSSSLCCLMVSIWLGCRCRETYQLAMFTHWNKLGALWSAVRAKHLIIASTGKFKSYFVPSRYKCEWHGQVLYVLLSAVPLNIIRIGAAFVVASVVARCIAEQVDISTGIIVLPCCPVHKCITSNDEIVSMTVRQVNYTYE